MNNYIVEPYLHIYEDRIYNPLTDRKIIRADSRYNILRDLAIGKQHTQTLKAEAAQQLKVDRWILPREEATDARFFLKYISLEANIAQERYRGSNFEVRQAIASSSGYHLPIGQKPSEPIQHLAGCEQTGSRILQHLHITAEGKAILCCQDYHSEYVVGDLRHQTIDEILRSDKMATMRRWVYGLDDAPKNFICRHCVFALSRL